MWLNLLSWWSEVHIQAECIRAWSLNSIINTCQSSHLHGSQYYIKIEGLRSRVEILKKATALFKNQIAMFIWMT